MEKANEQTNLLESVLQQSNIIATTRFNKPVLGMVFLVVITSTISLLTALDVDIFVVFDNTI